MLFYQKIQKEELCVETSTGTGFIHVFGEISTKSYVDISKIVRDTVKEIGYTNEEYGFDYKTCVAQNINR